MKTINLISWRQQKRNQDTKLITQWIYFSLVIGLFIGIILYLYALDKTRDAQKAVAILKTEIKQCDKALVEIAKYQDLKKALIGRMEVVQKLKSSRVEMVHLIDELVKIMPDGVILTLFKRVGDLVTIQGTAEANTNVATLLHAIEMNPWMGQPTLSDIRRPNEPETTDKVLITAPSANEFEITFTLEPKKIKKGHYGIKSK